MGVGRRIVLFKCYRFTINEFRVSVNRRKMSSSDSGPEDRNPPKKSSKKSTHPPSDEEPIAKRKKQAKSDKGAEEEVGGKFLLGSKRFVSISEFRGKKLIDIREWYGDEEDLKPGKKGISLSKEQFEKLLAAGPKILKKVDEDI